ncbi:MAG TPA: HNH endonuclease signature motif containing protein [Acidimicrobiia bacterium]|nr:HNH endonuclease signature motif containing protein [Acidimicrobiia bacterium]
MPRGFRGGECRARAVARLIARDGDCCWYCGGEFDVRKRTRTIDHVVPLTLGGTSRLENLRLACGSCNHRKGAMNAGAYLDSRALGERRRLMLLERRRSLGVLPPKRAYCHKEIRWFAQGRWACRICHVSSLAGTRSPTTVPCRPLRTWLASASGSPSAA